MTRTCIFAGMIISTIAMSQNAYANVASDDIEVISVTASKQALAVNKTPDSVSVLSATDITNILPQHINQILAQAPATWISRGNGQEHLTAIRSPVLTGAGSCGAFFMGVDGISIRAPSFCNANQLFDVNYEQAASIDVLRSPSSTLYGGNALHGVINVISHDAFNGPSNGLSLQAGAEDYARVSAVYGQQQNQRAWLLQSSLTQENGYQSQSGYDQQKLSAIYQTQGEVWNSKTLLDLSLLNQETAGYISGFESYKDSRLRQQNPNPEAFRDAKAFRAYSAFSRQTTWGDVSITPYLRVNEMVFLQHYLPWKALEKNSHNSLGVQNKLSFTKDNVTWLIGADIDYTEGKLKETQAEDFSPTIPQGTHYDYEVQATQLAMYAQASWQHQNWQVRIGARAEQNSYDYDNQLSTGSACDNPELTCRFTRPEDQTRSFNAISPSVNVQYALDSNSLLYLKYAQGFRAPQATELFRLQNNQQVSDIDNENMDAWEAGYRWSNMHTSLHGAIFTMLKRDGIYQDTQAQNVSGAKTQHNGAEFEASHTFNEQWSIQAHLSYAEHEYKNDTQLVNSNIVGNNIDTAPNWMSQVNVNYQANPNLSAQLSWQFLDEYYLDPQNTAEYEGHQLLDVHVHYALSTQVNLSLHMLNLANEAYAERADYAFGSYRYFVGQPRRAFINLQWLF